MTKQKLKDMKTQIEFTRVNNDVNGNPRYVCHFVHLLTKEELDPFGERIMSINEQYDAALARAHKIGGRKFHNKQYGGGIVFQSYNIEQTEQEILQLVEPCMGDFNENGDLTF